MSVFRFILHEIWLDLFFVPGVVKMHGPELLVRRTISAFDTSKTDSHCTISLGFSADKLLRSEGFKKRKVSDSDMLGLRMDAKTVLQTVCQKLVQKTPIKYPLAQSFFRV